MLFKQTPFVCVAVILKAKKLYLWVPLSCCLSHFEYEGVKQGVLQGQGGRKEQVKPWFHMPPGHCLFLKELRISWSTVI